MDDCLQQLWRVYCEYYVVLYIHILYMYMFNAMYIYIRIVWCIHVHVYNTIYVREQSENRTGLRPSDGFEAGQMVSKWARRFLNFSLTALHRTVLGTCCPHVRLCTRDRGFLSRVHSLFGSWWSGYDFRLHVYIIYDKMRHMQA